ncbi:DUF3263 domain-containing protein [Agrococcus citreus]|uniref:DUF3263 domain-containing protein n=1 Tax=Agrococcus citreus TaxID=84643 RepID=A0ABN1YS08_9MICO
MPTEPRIRRQGTADEAAALAFAAAEAAADALDILPRAADTSADTTAEAAPDTTEAPDAPAGADRAGRDDLARARAERIRGVLDFEGRWSSHGGAKARAIRAEFGWSTTRYYQVLDAALETPEALRHDPMLVRRLLRLRDDA